MSDIRSKNFTTERYLQYNVVLALKIVN